MSGFTCRTPVPLKLQPVALFEVGSCCKCVISGSCKVDTQAMGGLDKRAQSKHQLSLSLFVTVVPCLSGSQSLHLVNGDQA